MLTIDERKRFEALNMPYPAIAIKFHTIQPAGVERAEEQMSFCSFLRKAQDGQHFYIDVNNDSCDGKYPLGMAPKDPIKVSGMMGVATEMFASPAPNIKLHTSYPVVTPGVINYVEYCPIMEAEFNPDLIFCVANTDQAEYLMRATSYFSGDFWETRLSGVMSCAWMYAYPYLTGKMNFCVTGMHHGLRRRKLYPAGLMMISIPYQKLPEVLRAMAVMPRYTIAFREDEESKAEFQRRLEKIESFRKLFL